MLIRKSAKSRATKTATGGAKYDTFDGPDFTFLLGNRLGEKKKGSKKNDASYKSFNYRSLQKAV